MSNVYLEVLEDLEKLDETKISKVYEDLMNGSISTQEIWEESEGQE